MICSESHDFGRRTSYLCSVRVYDMLKTINGMCSWICSFVLLSSLNSNTILGFRRQFEEIVQNLKLLTQKK